MGSCPQGVSILSCPFTTSFNTWMWLDPGHKLPPLAGQTSTISVSGFSGGGSTAANLHTVHSDYIKGAGMLASGVYGDKHFRGQFFGSNEFMWSVGKAYSF